jgi:hypothetical protein
MTPKSTLAAAETDDPKVHGYYWRTPGIPVLVYESKRFPGVFMFTGGGLHGLAKHPDLPGIKYFGPIFAPASVLSSPEKAKESPSADPNAELEQLARSIGWQGEGE